LSGSGGFAAGKPAISSSGAATVIRPRLE
jgi:hypothetical protein